MDDTRTADGLPRRGRGRAGLAVVGVLELASLVVLLGNLATVHDAGLARVLGPVHGTLYLLGIALAFRATRATRSRLLAVIPSVGAFVAWRVMR